MRRGLPRLACAALAILLSAAPAAAQCRLALTLGLDVSSSVDATEYGLQIEGLAAALEDAEVRAAILQIPGASVALQVFEWSGVRDQQVVQDWVEVTGPGALDAIAARLRAHVRSYTSNATALGHALDFARAQHARAPACALAKIDISGDGQSNTGIPPQQLYTMRDFGEITVNGLAIQSDEAALARYYRFFVIYGEGAFVATAEDFDAYAAAIKRKLIRELGVPQIGMR